MDRARFEEIRAAARARIAERADAERQIVEAVAADREQNDFDTYVIDADNVDATIAAITSELLKG